MSSRSLPSVVGLLAFVPTLAIAQASGTLGVDRGVSILSADSARVARAESRTLLLANPLLSTAVRTSAPTASITAGSANAEARLQLNVCDLVTALCGTNGADHSWSLALITPVSKSDSLTTLGDLDGLASKTRVESSFAFGAADDASPMTASLLLRWTAPDLSYRSAVNAPAQTTNPSQWAARASAGWKSATRRFVVGYGYEDARKESDATMVCVASNAGAGVSTCRNQVIGAPTETFKSMATVEWAQVLPHRFAFAVTGAFDTRGSGTGWDLPIWFIPSIPARTQGDHKAFAGDPGLGGGIRLGYRTATGRATLALFVGTFKL